MILAKRGWTPGPLFSAGMLSISGAYCVSLAQLLLAHLWILSSAGRAVPCDFLAFWAAGQSALSAHAASAYDPDAFHAVQTGIAGPFPGYFYWNYPPVFFFVAVLLTSIPYVPAFLAWVAATTAAYAAAIGVIVRRWEGAAAACSSPILLLTAFGGQNGFLTAALLGGFLVLLPRRPVIAGILLGFLTYKPQLGILFPIALIAGGYWRALCSAALVTIMAAGAAALAFGPGIYGAFFQSLPVVTHAYLTLGGEGWAKIQSVYAIARFVGATDLSAWFVQGIVIASSAVAVIGVWRSDLDYELKAASLTVAAMLSTPYLHVYDFPVLVVALAFLYRQRPFDRIEWISVTVVNLLLLLFLAQIAPVGPGIAILVGALILRRAAQRAGMGLSEILWATS